MSDEQRMFKRFDLKCLVCGSEDVTVYGGYDGDVWASCHACENSEAPGYEESE